jgi:raffinose/stachyose/melibiose transport system permease protein
MIARMLDRWCGTRAVRDNRPYLFLLLLLASLPLRAETTLDIPFFAGGFGTAFFEESARKFEAAHPGVRVNIYGDPRMWDKVRVRALGGDYPDATTAPLYWPNLIRAGKLVDLTPWLEGPNWEGDARWIDTFQPGVLENWRIGGRYYGLPHMTSAWVLYYNKGLFRAHGWQPPRTWDEFFALGAKMKRTGVAPLSLPGVYMRYGDSLFQAAHYNLVGPEGWRAYMAYAAGTRSDPRFIRAAEVARRATNELMITGWLGMTHTAAQLAFLEGRCAMTVSGTWMVNEMKGKIPDNFELGAVNLPVFADGVAEPSAAQTGSDYFFVFAKGDAARERLTVDFLRFLTSRERALTAVRMIDSPVAVRGVPPENFSPRMREAAQVLAGARETFNTPPAMLVPPGYGQAIIDARQQLFTGRISAQEFGVRLEAAAAADRDRDTRPDSVRVKHGAAALALLAALAGAVVWLAWKQKWHRRPAGDRQVHRRDADATDSYFGAMRLPLALGFVGPAFALFGVIVVLPGLASFAWAFTHWDGIGARTAAGWFNFKWLLLESDAFWAALTNNLYLMIVPALVVVPLSLFFATLVHRGVWGAKTFRALFLFPNLLGGIAATLLWMSAYEPHSGIVNAGLVALGNALDLDWLRGFAGHAWLSQDNLYRSVIPIYIWMGCGFNLILYLAAMEGIDPQLYEAAEMDGAPGWRQFFDITLPMIWEVIVISAVFIVIGGLNAFELIWLLTSQEPVTGSHTLSTLMVTTMFQDFQVGRATAIAVMMFIFVFVGSAVVMRGLKREAVES